MPANTQIIRELDQLTVSYELLGRMPEAEAYATAAHSRWWFTANGQYRRSHERDQIHNKLIALSRTAEARR